MPESPPVARRPPPAPVVDRPTAQPVDDMPVDDRPAVASAALPKNVRSAAEEFALRAAAQDPLAHQGEAVEDDEPQEPCPHCNRTFRLKILEKHVKNCQKVFMEKRKAFDVGAVSAEAAKLKAEHERQERIDAKKNGHKKEDPNKVPAWKKKSEAFRNVIKNAREVDQAIKEGKPLKDLPPPVPTDADLDDRTPCPHCRRKFGSEQAKRHIPKCKESMDKKKLRGK